jgi:hypothetical protein
VGTRGIAPAWLLIKLPGLDWLGAGTENWLAQYDDERVLAVMSSDGQIIAIMRVRRGDVEV